MLQSLKVHLRDKLKCGGTDGVKVNIKLGDSSKVDCYFNSEDYTQV